MSSVFRTVQLMPESLAVVMGNVVSTLIYCILANRRRIGLSNLALAFPDYSQARRRKILRASYRGLARTLVETLRLARLDDDEIRSRITYAEGNQSILERARARGRGIMFITAHLSNWEVLAIGSALHGFPMKVVARRQDNPLVDAAINRVRCRGGNVIVVRGKKDSGIYDLLDDLRQGGSVGIILDQYSRRARSIAVPFFGVRAHTHRGPALLAVKTGAAALPVFIRRCKNNRRRFVIQLGEEITLEPGLTDRERVSRFTEEFQKAIEAEVCSRPEDWLWIHERWKNSPDQAVDYPELRRHRLTQS